jgi:predicted dehydrogenase
MIKIGTIGTGFICEEFISVAKKNQNIKVVSCYSRSKEKAKDFIKKLDIKARAFDNFQEMALEIDAVYIASPNGLHFEQAMYFLQQQKHVFLEKPLTLDHAQALKLHEVAMKNKVILMEAFKLIHAPQFNFLDDFVKKYSPFAATFSLNKYSSRMSDVKKGIFNSVFDEKLGKGSTYDMLVYPVELAISLFGPVRAVQSMSAKLQNGVNFVDTVILKHESNILTSITCSKSANGLVGSEILSDEGTLSFQEVLKLNNIELFDIEENKKYKLFENDKNEMMSYELDVFAKMIIEDDLKLCDYLLKISSETVRVLNIVEKNSL